MVDAAKPSELSLVYADADNALAVFRNVLVQVRQGPLTKVLFDRISGRTRTLQRVHPAGIGLLVVLEPGAPIPDAELRGYQTAMIKEMGARGRVCTSVALLGSGVANDLRRVAVTTTRTIANVSEQHVEGSVAAATRWLAHALLPSEAKEFSAALERAVDTLRERYLKQPVTR